MCKSPHSENNREIRILLVPVVLSLSRYVYSYIRNTTYVTAEKFIDAALK